MCVDNKRLRELMWDTLFVLWNLLFADCPHRSTAAGKLAAGQQPIIQVRRPQTFPHQFCELTLQASTLLTNN